MAPPAKQVALDELQDAVQIDAKGKRRKTPDGRDINLAQCPMKTMTQYSCEVVDDRVRCQMMFRFFRECRDKKGLFTVETTAWESPEVTQPIMDKMEWEAQAQFKARQG
ncbi:hypothetical protein Cpir12675_000162 [Ceratocystis pirilliformis]|uniref:Mitochondrial export protein Som1 n=4 Tax=Ceratocystis TaxID=5157 RepID=A0A0F8B7R7_CERFI|nr:Mitochondrial export protein Som1 [Ceratocystis platani]PHH50846.1 hypothetical protein CFIMG_006310RA [Ceratocystis fimbriata CBS 114723]